MKTYARLIAAAGIASALAAPLPAGAAGDAWITVQHAPSGATEEEARQWTPREGSVLRGNWKTVVDAGAYSSLRSFTVAIQPEDPNTPSPQGAEESRSYPTGWKGSDRIEMVWDTRTLTPFNAYYKVVASAVSWIEDRREVAVTRLAVDNPPAAPVGVEAALREEVPVLTWKTNKEPDFRRYLVLRSSGTLPFRQIASTAKTTFSDDDAPRGVSLRYEVVAVRASVVDPDGISSQPSKPTPPVTTAAPEGAEAPSQPVEIPAPVAAPVAPVKAKHTVLPRRDVGFAPQLPYSDPIPQPPAENLVVAPEAQSRPQTTFVSLPSVVAGARMVAKPPFVAAALVLIVAALHTAMAARRLFRAA